MSNRSAKFAATLVASILAGANFAAMAENNSKPTDTCQSSPKGTAPAGSHWYYHLDRTSKTKCWYLGEAKTKAAKGATAEQQASPAPDATMADAAPAQPQPAPQPQAVTPAPPPQQPQQAMRKSVADARAELTSSQTNLAPAAPVDASQASSTAPGSNTSAATADANLQSSAPTARWLDASSMAGTNGTRLAAAQPQAPVQADVTPATAGTAAPTASAAVEAPAEKSSASTQMLLIVMVGALALAGLVSALVFRLTRTRTPPYQIRDEWRAPWDSLHTGRATPAPPSRERPVRPSEESPMRLSEVPPRRAEPPMPRREVARDLDEADDATRQITAMLQRLARSAAT